MQQLIALGDGLLKLPTLTNLTDGTVYGTFDIAARFLDRTSAFALRVDSVPEQGLVVSVPAQVGAVVTDSFEVSTDLGSEAVWEPLISSTNYVGAANSQEFDAGWSRVATQVDTRSWTRAGTHFLRLKRTWQN